MKKLFLFLLFAIFIASGYAQNVKRDTSIVQRVRGVPVFVMCEPLAAYDVTGSIDDDIGSVQVLNALSGTTTYRTIKESCQAIVENAQRKQKKGKLKFDAIIVSDDGHNGTCIIFK